MSKPVKINEVTFGFLNELFGIIAPAKKGLKPGCFSCQLSTPGTVSPFSNEQSLQLASMLQWYNAASKHPGNGYDPNLHPMTAENVLVNCYEIWPMITDGCEFNLDENESLESIHFIDGAIRFKFVTHSEIEVQPQ